jgi:hypothetical protein
LERPKWVITTPCKKKNALSQLRQRVCNGLVSLAAHRGQLLGEVLAGEVVFLFG